MTQTFEQEIATKVAEHDQDGKPLHPTWIAQEICHAHLEGLATDSAHADFWRVYALKAVRAETGRFITKNYGSDAEEKQAAEPLFPGFDHVQRRYIITREGDEVGVLAIDLTDEEIDAKAQELRRRGRSCLAHADELDRFKSWRKTLATETAAQ